VQPLDESAPMTSRQVAPPPDCRISELLSVPVPRRFDRHRRDAAFGKSVLITGAAGAVGSALARQVAAGDAKRLTLLDTNESGLFDLAAELESGRGSSTLRLEIAVGSVTSGPRLARLFARAQPNHVIHAAAYKHVSLMEAHPEEAVETNVVGTLNVCLAAEESGAQRVVFLSIDKAVAPISLMGATKQLGERLVQALARDSGTNFCVVRFGNVLRSRGSVVPTFERQIRQGGPITLTHRAMERYFITLPDVVDLIVEAAFQARGGETFVLDMDAPVRLVDLAAALIRLHGHRPAEDIQIREIGLRPGERLAESLFGHTERQLPTAHPRIWQATAKNEPRMNRADLIESVHRLRHLADLDSREELVDQLFCLVQPERHQQPASVASPMVS
jgi:FlaA1/EpsC-like NDP-sugar epimerase